MNLTEAFQKMDLLESEDFDVSSSMDSADLKNFLDNDVVKDSEVDIFDIEKEEDEPLEDSYVGKIITECNICHSKFYKDPDEIVIDQETGNCNVDEECPICFSQDGYKIIGKVAPYEEAKDDIEAVLDDEEEGEDDFDTSETDEIDKDELDTSETDDMDESLTESKHLKSCDELDETVAGTVAGAAAGLLAGHPIKGALIGSGMSNIAAGKGGMLDYAKIGGALGGWKGALAGTAVGGVAGNAINNKINSKNLISNSVKRIADYTKESLDEDIESATIQTDDTIMSMDTDETGKVTITSEPRNIPMDDEEVIAPINDEDVEEIAQAQPIEDEEEVEVNDFDENSFDDLGESYLRRVYENVNSYKTTKIFSRGNKIIVEGVINFTSGKNKKTSFIFESYKKTASGKLKFIGENAQITKGKKAFTITGNLKNKTFITESFNYNYRQKDSQGKSSRLYGTIKK